MSAQWFYQNAGQQSGPVDPRELRRLAEDGIVGPDTLVRKGASGNWVRAEQVQGFLSRSGSDTAKENVPHDLEPTTGSVGEPVAAGSPPTPPPLSSPVAEEMTANPRRLIHKRLNKRFQRFTPILLLVGIGLLAVSVILQGIMCVVVVSVHKQVMNMGSGVPVEVTNREVSVNVTNGEIPVEVTNSEVSVNVTNGEIPVEVTNSEVPVNVRNHYIISGDPIPVEVTNPEVDVHITNR